MKLKHILFFLSVLICSSVKAQKVDISLSSKKVSPNLLLRIEKENNTNSQQNLYKFVCLDIDKLKPVFKEAGVSMVIMQSFPEYQAYILQIKDIGLLKKLLLLPSVIYADLYYPPKEELEIGSYDPTLNRINFLQQKYPASNGAGLTVSIKENIFDTSDIDFTGRYVSSGIASTVFSTHASIMATQVAGAGNTSHRSLGVSPGATLTSSSFFNFFPDASTHFQKLKISVQNHSYGTIVENFYGAEARAYDQQLNAMPDFAHVFSVGNSGNSTPTTGMYSGLPGVANMTGNFKSAKNIITVGATDSFSNVPDAISKGPAYDGRLKPEITAFGDDGSSGAAAIVSGTVISLQHLYKQRYGSLPPTALIRAILFNSADDIGTEGIDFSSGYGSVNAAKAADNIFTGRFFSGNIVQSSTQRFTVNIPDGIKKAKFTLAWNDPANTLLAEKALVNDADMLVVYLSDNNEYMPWVLNHSPHSDSMQLKPERRTDTLNNSEQVTIDDPLPGNYEIRIFGSSIPSGSQTIYVAYQFDSSSYFEFTSPVRNNYFLAGNPNTIRWQHTLSGFGKLEYTLDNTTWNLIDDNVDFHSGFYVWDTPDTISSARLRMNGQVNVISDTFVISTPPMLQVGFNCDEDFMLWWNKIKNTSSYELYKLGAKYMELFTSQPDTFRIYKKVDQPTLHYAVRPVLVNGIPAQRSATYNYTTQGVRCYISSFFGELANNKAELTLELGTSTGIQSFFLEKQTGDSFITLEKVNNIVQLSYTFTDIAIKTGLNNYRIRFIRTDGQVSYSDLATVYYFGKQLYLIYPNPVPPNSGFNVLSSSVNTAEIRVYSMNGQLVMKYKRRRFDIQLSTAKLNSGVYFYTILEENKIVQKGKLVVY